MKTQLAGVAVGLVRSPRLFRGNFGDHSPKFLLVQVALIRQLPHGGKSPSDSMFPWPHVENAKSAQLNVFAVGERTPHGLEYRFNGNLGLGLGYASPIDDFVDDVQLAQGNPPLQDTGPTPKCAKVELS